MRAAARTEDGRTILRETADDLLAWRPRMTTALVSSVSYSPYPDLGRPTEPRRIAARRPVFITARFRSGSTLLWNLFRNIDECTAYYEPLNERRWFDPRSRGTRVDPTHRVDDYWREYEGLGELTAYYDEDWTRRRLYMDEDSWDPAMAEYIRILVRQACGRAVLQFNRIDFRLPWIRRTFPEAHLVHLYRHPRNQWCSTLGDLSACPPSATLAEFRHLDGFYLLTWASDLKSRFPFLQVSDDTHPYRLFYFIWKLSYLFGVAFADHSLSFESLVAEPETELRRLLDRVELHGVDLPPLVRLIEPLPSRWREYASDEWFRAHEQACEQTLLEFFEPYRAASGERSGPGHALVETPRFPELIEV